jgi:hypothetical protein
MINKKTKMLDNNNKEERKLDMLKSKIEEKNFNVIKFWRELEAMLIRDGKKRVWLSKVTPIKQNTINNWVAENRWPSVIALYYFSRVTKVPMDQLLELSIE